MNVFELMAKLSLDKGDYEKGIKDAQDSGEGFASKLGGGLKNLASVGAKALTATTTAVVAFGASAVKVGADFDSSMSQVAATMGFTVSELNDSTSEASQTMQKLRDFAQDMGATTAFSASQASDALNYMALAGYDAETSMKMLPTVLNLASAGGMELATASDMVTDAQSALGLTLEETTAMVDKMATASSKSNTSVAQLGEAFLTIGGTAKNLSGGTTELSTALGLLADNGIKGAEGGTALRNIVLSLSAPTDKASKALNDLGVAVYDAEGNMRPLNDVFGDLNDSMSKMNQGEKTQVLNEIFNKVDLKSVNALMDTNVERWASLTEAIENSSGSAEAMAEVQLDNLSGDVTLLKSAFEGFQIAVSEGSTGALRNFVQFASTSLSNVTTAYKEGGVKGAMDAIGEALSEGLAMVLQYVPEVVSAGGELLSALCQGLMDNIPLLLETALSLVNMALEELLKDAPLLITGATEMISQLASGISEALPELLPKVVDVVIAVVEALIENAPKLLESALQLILALADGLFKSIPRLIIKLPELVTKIVKGLIDLAGNVLDFAVELITKIWEGLKDNLHTLIDNLPEILTAIKDGLLAGVDAMMDVGKNLIEGLWNGIKDVKDWIMDKIKGFMDGIVGGIKSFFGINSPSKLMAEIGGFMAQGIGVGWDDQYADVKKRIEDSLSMDMSASVSTSVSGGQSLMLNAIYDLRDSLTTDLTEALADGLKWEWDDRTLGRMVKTYA